MSARPTPEQVLTLAPDSAAASAALPLANPGAWSAAACDDGAVWGQYLATSAEPYNVAVDLSDDVGGPAYRCDCPSRKIPCKHALGLLLLYANNGVVPARRMPFAAEWLQRRAVRARSADEQAPPVVAAAVPTHDGGEQSQAGAGSLGGRARAPSQGAGSDPARSKRQLERSERMRAGLRELDRWLLDRVRAGLANPELGEAATWDRLAARLVDAQCGGLANRVKRVATKVGQHARWHEDVLEEMALLHALAVGAQHTSSLPADLADGVHVATGLTVAKDDVLAGVASTARWLVVGESRSREDRITVQRTWLAAGAAAGGAVGATTWAMVLAFGAFGREVMSEYEVGTAFDADVHWYPGGLPLRAIIGRIHGERTNGAAGPASASIADALSSCGWAVASEPWIERYPMCIAVVPAPVGNGRWVLADGTGSIPVSPAFTRVAELVCVSAAEPVVVMGEWSTEGFLPLTVFAGGQAVML